MLKSLPALAMKISLMMLAPAIALQQIDPQISKSEAKKSGAMTELILTAHGSIRPMHVSKARLGMQAVALDAHASASSMHVRQDSAEVIKARPGMAAPPLDAKEMQHEEVTDMEAMLVEEMPTSDCPDDCPDGLPNAEFHNAVWRPDLFDSAYGFPGYKPCSKPGISTEHHAAWCCSYNDANKCFMTIDLKEEKRITGVVTQGRQNVLQWVTQFTVEGSNDLAAATWTQHGTYIGNTDSNTKKTHDIDGFDARYVRIRPKEWRGHVSMRAAVCACGRPTPDADEIVGGKTT